MNGFALMRLRQIGLALALPTLLTLASCGHTMNAAQIAATSGSVVHNAAESSPQTMADAPLPAGSRLISVGEHRLHVRSLGMDHDGPAIVLLSGPTDHWHSDSGWFALLQPMLARHFRVHAIDRAGHGFGDTGVDGSYQRFADDLAALLPQLETEPVLVVAFASSNLSLHQYLARHGQRGLRAALLIDPDGLHPDLLSFYAEQAGPFQQGDKLAEYVNAGKYDARAESFYRKEREHLQAILPVALADQMDWPFYDAIAGERRNRARILTRFAAVGRYDQDVRGAAAVPWPATLPVWSYDTDFERNAIDAATEPAEKTKLEQWRQLSSTYMTDLPGHCRIGSASREHLATVAEADRLVRLIEQLARGSSCPPETR
ncbi:MAG TPA: alpha/beta hydrolase [Permianibacter sp.]|nr:alpha/beta hydrolase [Permianibacter sp.]